MKSYANEPQNQPRYEFSVTSYESFSTSFLKYLEEERNNEENYKELI